MSYTAAAILLALQSLPVYYEDRDLPQKEEQYRTIAEQLSIAVSSSRGWPGAKADLAAIAVTVAWHESSFSLRIQAGQCKPHECDRGRAAGLWQPHAASLSNPKLWPLLPGLDAYSTGLQAREAVRGLVRARRYCLSLERKPDDWVAFALGAYAGRRCTRSLPDMRVRIETFGRVRAKLAGWVPS